MDGKCKCLIVENFKYLMQIFSFGWIRYNPSFCIWTVLVTSFYTAVNEKSNCIVKIPQNIIYPMEHK